MKKLDRYIIYNVIVNYIFITFFLQILSIVIDISQRMHRLENNQGSIKQALIFYYPFWSIWLANTFSPISVFLSIIFFTSRLTKNSEMTAILGSGISFKRITIPYLISAFIIGGFSLIINYSFLPMANKIKNKFHYQYLLSSRQKSKYENSKAISAQISNNEYLFIRNFSKKENIGQGFTYQKFNGKKLVYILKAKNIFWSKKYRIYILHDYIETYIKKNKDILSKGFYIKKFFSMTPEELLPEEYIAETMTISELKKFIDIEKRKGIRNINTHLNEYYQRTSLPFSTFIFSILGLSISSKIKKGGIGGHLIIGLILAFFYIFFIEISKVYSTKDYFPSYLSVWLPNVIMGVITLFIYWNRSKH
ncbi:YjgP/YjgQ family permease [Blattabacterium sp. (Cryptocercus kyebangensis)]|uniref:LptF/LptG family permease n=1 Tax=Blattabacterium sp. (Cryptocercus kyebangensis) TaxID=298656 RepID=UPI000D7CF1A8|nr:LptF/LptG family permease [Blattabacterium sp. (Cryptocercus kyebangensis)]AWU43795.1 YjgP/YjgQ family permease [Blattabacterium sp. (Cryptocercus kyebangensis)]